MQGARHGRPVRASRSTWIEEAIGWVHATIDSMTARGEDRPALHQPQHVVHARYLDGILDKYHVGGMRYRSGDAAEIQEHTRYAQSRSKVPLLIASNPEMGGFGSSNDGTLVSTHLQAGSHPDKSIASDMGHVAGAEMPRLGCNWAFAPIVDIHRNWRNTVVATRASATPRSRDRAGQGVLRRHQRAQHGLRDQAFPRRRHRRAGPARGHVLQHPAASTSGTQTYGRVYRALIDHGAQSIMVGHIGAPELSRKLRPGITDEEILPATLAPELLQDLLRERTRVQRCRSSPTPPRWSA